MPEGPEIRRSADQLAGAIAGKTARLVEFQFPHLARRAAEFRDVHIAGVEARGKAMLTHFANGWTIYSHNQLYGQWRILKRGEAPHPTLQIRIAIHTDTTVAVLYSASEIELWPRDSVYTHPYLARLGTELLADDTSVETVLAQIDQPRFQRKSLAGLLLDQHFLAGVGNYLRSEILFVARVHPHARLIDLTARQRAHLAAAALDLTRQSYRTRGITNSLTLAHKLKARGWLFGRYRHWVFDREGESCHVCATVIKRIDLAGRGLYWCAHCQAQ